MRKRMLWKQVICMLLLAAMLLSGCGRETQAPTQDDSTEAAVVPADISEQGLVNDPTLLSHIHHNQQLIQQIQRRERLAEEFRFYITNNQTMEGFVMDNDLTGYQAAMQVVFNLAYSQYDDDACTAYTLDGASVWQEEPFDSSLLRNIQRHSFYADKALGVAGPLESLFDQQESPFTENGLTVIVSNFMEPDFNLNPLADGIKDYFHDYPGSAASIVGLRSNYGAPDGGESSKLYIPQKQSAANGSTFVIDYFYGEVPCYVVVVGPQSAVESYTKVLSESLTKQEVPCAVASYNNTDYIDKVNHPLDFEWVRAWQTHKKQKATAPLYSSYNTGIAKWSDTRDVWFAEYDLKIRDESTPDENAPVDADAYRISDTAQLALVSVDAGSDDYRYEANYSSSMYLYDQVEQDWVPAGKNAEDMLTVTLEKMRGLQESEENMDGLTILADNWVGYYLAARLNMTDSEMLPTGETYRVEVQLQLNEENPALQSKGESPLLDYSVTSAAYYNLELSTLRNGYRWSGPASTQGRERAAHALARTPNLEAFLDRLFVLEKDFAQDTQVIEYIDFVFTIPEEKAR